MNQFTFNIPDFRTTKNNLLNEIKPDVNDAPSLARHYGTKAIYKAQSSGIDMDIPLNRNTYLGTQIFTNLVFGDLNDVTKNNYIPLGQETAIPFNAVELNTVLMTVTKNKRIVKTSLQGKDGTIKEYIGSDDYIITATGVVNNVAGKSYPESEVRNLHTICQIPDQISVTSKFLQLFGIDYVVIESFQFAEQRGIKNQQAFEITMSSDEAPEITGK